MKITRSAEQKQIAKLEQEMIDLAFRALDRRYRVLAPASEARVIWREFDPCKAVQAIATVEWPAVVGMQEVVLTHVVMDGDSPK